MAALQSTLSLNSYLAAHPDLPRFHVRPRADLILMTAYHLANERGDSLTLVYMVWAMLRVQGSIAKDLLTACGLTEDKLAAACATPALHSLDMERFLARIVAMAQDKASDLIGTEHVLMAALTDDLLQARLAAWGVDVALLTAQVGGGAAGVRVQK